MEKSDLGDEAAASGEGMQVWIVNHFALTPDQAGGTRHIGLAKELHKHDIDVTIVGAGRHHISDRNHVPDGVPFFRERVDGVRFHWIKTPSSSPKYWRRIWNNITFAYSVIRRRGLRDLPRPDVIIGTSPDLISALSAYATSRVFGVPFVLEIRDIWPLSAVQLGYFSERHPFIVVLRLIEKFLYKHADRIITLLPDARRHIIPLGANPDHITWIPNGISIGEQPCAKTYEPADDKHFTLMYAGSHGNANNLTNLLDAAEIIQSRGLAGGLRIRLVGEGPNKPMLVEYARNRGLDFVTFEPAVPKKKIGAVLGEADAFCLVFHSMPIYRYGISANKLFDYLAVGRPVIIALAADYNPVCHAGAGICVPPEDPEALADAIVQLKSTPVEARIQMALNAQKYARDKHSMDALGTRLSDLLKSLFRLENTE